MSLSFRKLKETEIDVRVATVTAKGVSLLLYKDARCDMNILDETVGPYNWKREHTRDNANCIVSIYDSEKKEWVSKEDTGTESFTEKEKGLASDSFKRACFNWGIGRELYTAPFIWISADKTECVQGAYRSEYNPKALFGSIKTFESEFGFTVRPVHKDVIGSEIYYTLYYHVKNSLLGK